MAVLNSKAAPRSAPGRLLCLALCLCLVVAGVLLAGGRAGAQSDDHVNVQDSNATLLTLGGTAQDGNIESSGDVDVFRFVIAEADAPKDVWVFTEAAATSPLGDSEGKLYDDSGNVIAQNDDSLFGQSDSHFYLAADLDAGTYYVEVSAVGTGTGQYTLHTTTGTDQGGRVSEVESATALTLGTPVEGVIGSADDVDTYRLVLGSDTDVIFYTEADALDSVGTLLDDSGGEIQEVDDSEVSDGILDFFIGRSLEAGTHYISVRGSDGSVGPYKLHVESIADTSRTITLDSDGKGSAIGILSDEDDEDVFTFSVSGTKDIFVYTVGTTDTIGEISGTENDDGYLSPGNYNFLLGYSSSGSQTVTITGYFGETGPYRVFVETGDDQPGSTSTTATPSEPYVLGVIDSDGDEDWYKLDFSSTAADSDIFLFSDGDTDLVGTLYESDGTTEVSTDDDSGPGLNFLLKETFKAGETYYLKIEGYHYDYDDPPSDDIGPYALFAESATGAPLSLGDAVTGIIDPYHDADLYEIDLTGQTSDIDVWMYATGSLDTYADLYTGDGQWIGRNDDSGLYGMRRAFSLRAHLGPGTYYLMVRSWNTRVGGYGVRFERATDPPSSTSGAPTLALGQVKTGSIPEDGGTDYFRLDLGGKSNAILYLTSSTGYRYKVEVVGQSDLNEYPGFFSYLIRDSFSGSPYIKVSTENGGRYLLQAVDDTAYTNFVTGCTAATNALDPAPGDDLYSCQ